MAKKLPKGCSQERAEEIKRWAFIIWELHWKELAPVSNSRAKFVEYCIRDHADLDEDLMNKIKLAVQAQTKHWRLKKKADGKVIGIPTMSVWYNQGRYDDEFIDESSAAMMERAKANSTELATCEHEGCRALVHGPAYRHCADHLPSSNIDALRETYRSLGIKKSNGSIVDQCRKLYKEIGGIKPKRLMDNI